MADEKEWKLECDELYFKWIIERLKIPTGELTNDSFTGLIARLKELQKTRFTFTIHTDYNREFDGKRLRTEYYCSILHDEEVPNYILGPPVSVLEVLVGLSIRMCEEVLGDDTSWELFCLMLLNLGVVKDDGGVCDEEDLNEIITKWLNREFDFNGVGSPFPLDKNDEGVDQRKIDIWQQLSLYLDEIKYSEED